MIEAIVNYKGIIHYDESIVNYKGIILYDCIIHYDWSNCQL